MRVELSLGIFMSKNINCIFIIIKIITEKMTKNTV